MPPARLTTRCQGIPFPPACAIHAASRAARGLPASWAICPYVTTRPLGTARTSACTRLTNVFHRLITYPPCALVFATRSRRGDEGIRAARGPQGAPRACRRPRGAHRGAEVHQRLIEVVGPPAGEDGGRQFPERAVRDRTVPKEHPAEDAPDIGVKDRLSLAVRKCQQRPGRIAADAFQGQQFGFGAGQPSPYFCLTVRAIACRRTGRMLYPNGYQASRTCRAGASASARHDGYLRIHSQYLGMTRDTWVCCSMISETRMRYGSRV